jgi:hypothetical protein
MALLHQAEQEITPAPFVVEGVNYDAGV